MTMNVIKNGILAASVFFIISVPFSYLIFRKVNWILSFEIASGLFLGVLLMDFWQRNLPGIPATLADKSIIYEESAPYGNSIKAIITIGFFVLALSSFFAFFGNLVSSNKVPEQAQFALLFASSIYALIMWSFFSMKFRITNNSVEAVMPPFKYGVTFSEIKEIKTIYNIPWYVGWGIRLWGRRLAFVSMHKSAVEIEKRSGFFRRLVLTTQNPEEFVKMVRENLE